jgi:hypothetical protein
MMARMVGQFGTTTGFRGGDRNRTIVDDKHKNWMKLLPFRGLLQKMKSKGTATIHTRSGNT